MGPASSSSEREDYATVESNNEVNGKINAVYTIYRTPCSMCVCGLKVTRDEVKTNYKKENEKPWNKSCCEWHKAGHNSGSSEGKVPPNMAVQSYNDELSEGVYFLLLALPPQSRADG